MDNKILNSINQKIKKEYNVYIQNNQNQVLNIDVELNPNPTINYSKLSYLNKSNISIQHSFNKYNSNILLQNVNEDLNVNMKGWTSSIIKYNVINNKYNETSKDKDECFIKKIYNQKIDKNILTENFNNDVNSLIMLKGEPHIPIIYNINSINLSLIIEYCGNAITNDNCPVNWKYQMKTIYKILRKYNIYHNDIHEFNFCVKNNIIYLIDFGLAKHHIDFQYQNLCLEIIENNDNIFNVFAQIRQNGINIRKCIYCDNTLKNL